MVASKRGRAKRPDHRLLRGNPEVRLDCFVASCSDKKCGLKRRLSAATETMQPGNPPPTGVPEVAAGFAAADWDPVR
jgi:hypothetical protein